MCLFKSQPHKLKYRKFQLNGDIEKTPGPTLISCKNNRIIIPMHATRQSFLMPTKLPTVLNVFKTECEVRLWP